MFRLTNHNEEMVCHCLKARPSFHSDTVSTLSSSAEVATQFTLLESMVRGFKCLLVLLSSSGPRTVPFGLLLLLCGQPARADDAEQVERFLSRLGLADLQILHLERTLQQPLGEDAKLRTARRLADLYAARLTEVADQPERYAELLAGIERLQQGYPEANTTALQVMLLQADYNRAEKKINLWIADRAEAGALADARAILQDIAPKLQTYQQQLNGEVDELFKQIEDLPEGDALAEKESELRQRQSVAGRATYFAGWSNYYRGLARENPIEAAEDFEIARDAFQKTLGLSGEDRDYNKVETAWLGLESTPRARSVIGLGLAETATGNLTGSTKVFSWLQSSAVPPAVRDQALYWQVQGLINAEKFGVAEQFAADQIEAFSSNATQGKVSFCAALVRTGYAEGASEGAKQLGPLGIAGLTRMRQFGVLKALIARHQIDLSQQTDFYSLWLRGQQKFDDAETTKSKSDYQAAEKLFTGALAAEGANRDVASAARCRYNRGWARYRRGKYLPAARDFEQAITGLKSADSATAVQSAWLAHVCHRQMIPDSPTAANSAIEMLERIKRDFAGSDFAQRADYQIAKLRTNAASPEESIAALKKIAPSEENYLSARYDLCLLLHQQWQAAGKDQAKAKGALQELQQAVDVYTQAAGQREADRQLASVLKAADAALAGSKKDLSLAETYLGRADELAGRVEPGDSSLAEYHYRHMQLARAKGDASGRIEHAQWIVANAAGSRFDLPALVAVAGAIDTQIKSADSDQLPALHQQGYDIYTRLAANFGDSPEVIKAQKNARVAQSKRAYYAEQLGRPEVAAAAVEKLLAAYPKDRDYLRRAALAQFELGRYEKSLANWAALVRGLPAGEESWYEAKYYQIAALAKTDKEAARKVFDQFKLLYPDLGGEAQRARFEELARQL